MPNRDSLPDQDTAAVWGDGTPTLAEAERARTEALQTENDRLRAALEEWLAADDDAERDFTDESEARLTAAMKAAREALDGGEDV